MAVPGVLPRKFSLDDSKAAVLDGIVSVQDSRTGGPPAQNAIERFTVPDALVPAAAGSVAV
jgi:hypothetical protein